MRTLRGSAGIVGVGQCGLGEAHGFSALELMADASRIALADCGLPLSRVDGLFAGTTQHFMPTVSLAEYLGIHPTFSDSNMIGGASFVSHVLHAAVALDAGLCSVALVAYANNRRTARPVPKALVESHPWEEAYQPFTPIPSYALAASRHMYEFGTRREDLAAVAVAARDWARLTPHAFARNALSISDVLGSRMICDPLTLLDCCLFSDGGGAFVMTRADQAKDLRQTPVYFLGGGTELSHHSIANMGSLVTSGALASGRRAYEMAKVRPTDIDVAMLYDAFTICTIMFLEDLGFCAKGEGGAFVTSGAISPGGSLPVNTHGGGLSCVHPGMNGIFLVIEAVLQLRRTVGDRQVKDPEIALIHGTGGTFSSHATTLLGTSSALSEA